MEIRQVFKNKKQYMDLLFLADEQEEMIDRYLDQGDMFVLLDPEAVGECVVCDLGNGVFEIKNIATKPSVHGRGYGSALIEFVMRHYWDRCRQMLVGTGDSPLTVPFYKKCGFQEHHRLKNFFIDHYDHPIFECGVQLVDMVYLSREPAPNACAQL
ncbi:MAG: GNAT family N-acetyltransferase [Oscillospiraceae bacterium]|nr:GNAT family N-acetyltransferase [Oscillospiraceae bacterium]